MINSYTLQNTNFNLGHLWKREIDDANLLNSWVNYSNETGDYGRASYWVDAFGIVHFDGLVKSGTVGLAVFTAGTAWRPPRQTICICDAGSAVGRVDYAQDGQLYMLQGASSYASLANVHVRLWHNGCNYPTMQNGWVDHNTTFTKASYMRDPLGWVHVGGMIRGGTENNPCFTLPVGYRPSRTLTFPAMSNNIYGWFKIEASGVVTPYGSNVWFSMGDDIVFTEADSEAEQNWKDVPDSWFENNWTHYSTDESAQYQVDPHGMVHFRGAVKRSTGSVGAYENMISLSDAITPNKNSVFPVNGDSAFGAVAVLEVGALRTQSTTVNTTYTSLSGIRYKLNMFT